VQKLPDYVDFSWSFAVWLIAFGLYAGKGITQTGIWVHIFRLVLMDFCV
jgi:hypothetical protein